MDTVIRWLATFTQTAVTVSILRIAAALRHVLKKLICLYHCQFGARYAQESIAEAFLNQAGNKAAML